MGYKKKSIRFGLMLVLLWANAYSQASSSCKIRGFNYTGWDEDAYSTAASNQSLDNIKDVGCDWVAINFFYFQESF